MSSEASRAWLPDKYAAIHLVVNRLGWRIFPFCNWNVRAVSFMFDLRTVEFGKLRPTCGAVIMVPLGAGSFVTDQAEG